MKKLLVVLLVLGLVSPAMAAEWNWWGHARTLFSWSHYDEEISATGEDRINGNNGVVSIPEGGTTSMIGADVKANDTIEGHFQIGQSSAEAAKFRSLYGAWNFGAGKLKVGHMEMPITTIYSLPITTDDGPWVANGYLYETRQDSVQLQFGGFEVAFAKNNGFNTTLLGDVAGPQATPYYSVDQRLIPRIEAAYTFKTDVINVKGGMSFQTYELEDRTGDDSQTINSYVAALGARFKPGPFQVAVGGWYAVNPGNHSIVARGGPAEGLSYQRAVIFDDSVYDSEVYSVYLTGGFDINQTIGLGAGVSYMASSVDVDGTESSDDLTNWYFQVPITVAPGVLIVPEVGGFMFGDDEVDDEVVSEWGNQYYFSTKFQIMF